MNKVKITLIAQIIVLVLVISTFALWLVTALQKDKDFKNLLIGLPIIIIGAIMVPLLIRNFKSIRQNMPAADERSKRAVTRAAALSFYISIYLLLAIGWFGDDYFERPSQATGYGIMGMAVIFLISWFYFDRKGKL